MGQDAGMSGAYIASREPRNSMFSSGWPAVFQRRFVQWLNGAMIQSLNFSC